MRPKKVTVTGVAASDPIPVDYPQKNFKVSVAATVSDTATYTVQHTFDNVLAGDTPVWFDHSALAAQTANADGNYAYPIMATRINVTASTGSVDFYVLQAHD